MIVPSRKSPRKTGKSPSIILVLAHCDDFLMYTENEASRAVSMGGKMISALFLLCP